MSKNPPSPLVGEGGAKRRKGVYLAGKSVNALI